MLQHNLSLGLANMTWAHALRISEPSALAAGERRVRCEPTALAAGERRACCEPTALAAGERSTCPFVINSLLNGCSLTVNCLIFGSL